MRPAEVDVRFELHRLECKKTEDSGGDEPCMWILGFKVDADTLGPPETGVLPTLGVATFEGPPHFRHVVGAGTVYAGKTYPIPPALGQRAFRLRPARLTPKSWFPGIAGIICLLWDEDAFAPSTSEAGYKVFKQKFGPALATELNRLIGGDYDDALSRDANGTVLPDPPGGRNLDWRMARLRNAAGRRNAVSAIRDTVAASLKSSIEDAFASAAGLDEVIDPDDLLGVEAQAFLGDELGTPTSFTMTFSDDEAHYVVHGRASSTPVRVVTLESVVTAVQSEWHDAMPLWLKVCLNAPQTYYVTAYRQTVTTRFELRRFGGEPFAAVRWYLNGTRLEGTTGSVPVVFDPVGTIEGPPEDALAGNYPGGPGTLRFTIDGPVLEITNDPANGVFFGEVHALFSFPGDPPLANEAQLADAIRSGYDRSAAFSVIGIDLVMDQEYREHVTQCKRIVDAIDRKRIPVNFGKLKVNPGDPPPYLGALLEQVRLSSELAVAVGLEIGARPGLRG